MDPKDRLIVALDVPSVAAASAMVEKLGSSVTFYKIGYQLAFAGGLALADTLIRANKQVFLDLKLHDIGNTVGKGVESVAKLGATFLTVHAYPQTMHAAVDARKGSKLRILGVTVLTSYDDADLAAAGYDFTVPELVAERITRYASLVGRERVIAGSDCGFATFAGSKEVHPSIVWAKFEALAEGARLASKELWKKSAAKKAPVKKFVAKSAAKKKPAKKKARAKR